MIRFKQYVIIYAKHLERIVSYKVKRKRITQIFPWLVPIRKQQQKTMFYLGMKFDKNIYSKNISDILLPFRLFETRSILYNKETGFDMIYQENKVFNLKLAAKTLDGLLVKPNETFSFWQAVRFADHNTPYKEGLILTNGKLVTTPGGGMCQMSNLLFWMFLNSPLTIVERHTHNVRDFPYPPSDIPYGTDATVCEGWLDLKVRNNTDRTFQIKISFDEENIYGCLLTDSAIIYKYKVEAKNLFYFRDNQKIYEQISIFRQTLDTYADQIIIENHLYDNLCRIGYDLPPDVSIIEKQKIKNGGRNK